MKNTVRIILFLDCNFKCSYCCNEQNKFNSLFIEKNFSDINFDEYETVCITGGEPFLKKDVLYEILSKIPDTKPIFLYTNAILINDEDIDKLKSFNIVGINIGVHGVNQLKIINKNIDTNFSVRFQAQDKNKEKLFSMYPERVFEDNSKFWKLDDCYRDNEDWILLKDYL